MSKDFEQAYRELAESEVPDLWDRIEAGLESKSTPKKTAVAKKRRRKPRWAYMNRYSGIAAAAVCVAVVIPAALFLFRGGLNKGALGGAEVTEGIDTAAAADEALEFAADKEESCEAAPEEMDTGAGAVEEVMEDKAAAEMTDNSQMADGTENLKKESQSSEKQEFAMQEAETERADALVQEDAEGTVFEHVEIKVAEIENDFEREDGSFPGTYYTVTVQKDGSGGLKEGEELVVDLPAHYSFVLARDGVYEVDLVYQENGTYVLEGYHRRIDE